MAPELKATARLLNVVRPLRFTLAISTFQLNASEATDAAVVFC